MTRTCPKPSLAAAALGLGALLLGRPAAAEEPPELPGRASEPAPQPDLPAPSTRLSLALTGLGVSAAWYGAALGSSLVWHNGPWAPDMRVPVAGPWMAMPRVGCGHEEPHCGVALVVVRGILAGMDGVGQAGGLLVALESLFLPVRKSERAAPRREAPSASLRPVPLIAGRDGVGLGVVGVF